MKTQYDYWKKDHNQVMEEMSMKLINTHSTDPTKFHINVSLSIWEQIVAWLNKNDITWHADGNSYIRFDSKKDAVMFILRWG